MIKEADTSKSDERRVKNKPNALTHKQKGDTHIMCNQNWKLTAFFVVGLIMMIGLCSTTVLSHRDGHDGITGEDVNSGTVKVETVGSEFTEDSLVTLKVTYTATSDYR